MERAPAGEGGPCGVREGEDWRLSRPGPAADWVRSADDGLQAPDLLFSDLDRLRRLNREYPLQIVLAGKAHPHDLEGKSSIERLHQHIRELAGEIPVAFVPNYDLDVAAHLVSGVDLWLNAPPRPGSFGHQRHEGRNQRCAESRRVRWMVGRGLHRGRHGLVNRRRRAWSQTGACCKLYEKLGGTILPLYYNDRQAWIRMMKETISKIAAYFNSQRMMRRYATEAYLR